MGDFFLDRVGMSVKKSVCKLSGFDTSCGKGEQWL